MEATIEQTQQNATVTPAGLDFGRVMKAQDTLRIDPRKVHRDTVFNSRSELKDKNTKGLKEDIRKTGVHTSVILFESDGREGLPEKGVVCAVAGFTRLKLAGELIEETGDVEKYLVPYRMLDHVPTNQEAFELNISENFQRNELTTWDTAQAITRFEVDFGVKSAPAIAQVFGKSPAWVTQMRKLVSDQLHPEIQERLKRHADEKGYVPASIAMELLKITDKDEQLAALTEAEMEGAGVATRDAVKAKVAEAAEEGKAKAVALTIKNYRAILEELNTPPEMGEDEDAEDYKVRIAEWKANPLTDYARKTMALLDGKTKRTTYVNYLAKVVTTAPAREKK